MNEKEKAVELIIKMWGGDEKTEIDRIKDSIGYDDAKFCALIAVDEIIKETVKWHPCDIDDDPRYDYWLQVKTEIEKL